MSSTKPQATYRLQRQWSPHSGQQKILDSDSRFRVISCGRRWGKSALAGHELFEDAFEKPGSLNWWVAPSHDTSNIGFDMLTEFIPGDFIASTKHSPPKHIELINGSKIEFLSTSSKSGLVGAGVDSLVIDEAAQVPERKWRRDLRPTLSDTLGTMLAISTPRGRNWFFEYFQRGQSPDHPDVESWRESTYENPHVPDSEVDDARSELPERVFRQEYLAEFLDDAGGVFNGVRENIVRDYNPDEVDAVPPYRTGVDFARHQDYTVIITLDGENALVAFERLQTGGQVSWPQIQRTIEQRYQQFPGTVAVDATRDNKIVSDLEDVGVAVHPVKFTAPAKRRMVDNLAATIEAGEIIIPEIPALINELEVFEYNVTRAGNVRYFSPDGFHDDCVDSLCLANDAPLAMKPPNLSTEGDVRLRF